VIDRNCVMEEVGAAAAQPTVAPAGPERRAERPTRTFHARRARSYPKVAPSIIATGPRCPETAERGRRQTCCKPGPGARAGLRAPPSPDSFSPPHHPAQSPPAAPRAAATTTLARPPPRSPTGLAPDLGTDPTWTPPASLTAAPTPLGVGPRGRPPATASVPSPPAVETTTASARDSTAPRAPPAAPAPAAAGQSIREPSPTSAAPNPTAASSRTLSRPARTPPELLTAPSTP